jgi:hypothetical protein
MTQFAMNYAPVRVKHISNQGLLLVLSFLRYRPLTLKQVGGRSSHILMKLYKDRAQTHMEAYTAHNTCTAPHSLQTRGRNKMMAVTLKVRKPPTEKLNSYACVNEHHVVPLL